MTLEMALSKITPNKPTLALLIFLIALVAAVAGLVVPVTGAIWTHYSSIGALKDRFENYASVARHLETLQAQHDGLKGKDVQAGLFVAAPSSDEAAVLMERNLREAITSTGGHFGRAERLPVSDGALGEQFGIMIYFKGPVRVVDLTLAHVGMAFPYYYFEDIVLESKNASADEVEGQMSVYSFRRTN